MDYGSAVVQHQNQVEGRPYARGGTGGIAGASFVKFAFWPTRNPWPTSIAISSIALPGGLPGQLIVTTAPGAQAAFRPYGNVIMLTGEDGAPLLVADVVGSMLEISRRLAGIARVIEDTRFSAVQIGNAQYAALKPTQGEEVAAQGKINATREAYVHDITNLKLAAEDMKGLLFEVAAMASALPAAKPAELKPYKTQLADARANIALAAGILALIPSFIEDTNVPGVESNQVKTVMAQLRDALAALKKFLGDISAAAGAVAEAAKSLAEGAEDAADKLRKASGMTGYIALAVVAMIGFVMLKKK
jgi:hypothetical protein